jgi:hypothetical protein
MKGKNVFVNSISVSCIIIIPENFNLDNYISTEYADDKSFARALLQDVIVSSELEHAIQHVTKQKLKDSLKKTYDIFSCTPSKKEAYLHENVDNFLYHAAIQFFNKLGLIIYAFETESNNGQITFLFEEDIKKQLSEHRRINPNE